MSLLSMSDDELEALQWLTAQYYLKEANFQNGLIRDKTQAIAPSAYCSETSTMRRLAVALSRAFAYVAAVVHDTEAGSRPSGLSTLSHLLTRLSAGETSVFVVVVLPHTLKHGCRR